MMNVTESLSPVSLLLLRRLLPHQVVVGEPCDLLLDAELHLSLRGQRQGVVEDLLLLLDVAFQQLDLSVKSFQFVFVLPRLRLQLGLQQPEDKETGLPTKISVFPGHLDTQTHRLTGDTLTTCITFSFMRVVLRFYYSATNV